MANSKALYGARYCQAAGPDRCKAASPPPILCRDQPSSYSSLVTALILEFLIVNSGD